MKTKWTEERFSPSSPTGMEPSGDLSGPNHNGEDGKQLRVTLQHTSQIRWTGEATTSQLSFTLSYQCVPAALKMSPFVGVATSKRPQELQLRAGSTSPKKPNLEVTCRGHRLVSSRAWIHVLVTNPQHLQRKPRPTAKRNGRKSDPPKGHRRLRIALQQAAVDLRKCRRGRRRRERGIQINLLVKY